MAEGTTSHRKTYVIIFVWLLVLTGLEIGIVYVPMAKHLVISGLFGMATSDRLAAARRPRRRQGRIPLDGCRARPLSGHNGHTESRSRRSILGPDQIFNLDGLILRQRKEFRSQRPFREMVEVAS